MSAHRESPAAWDVVDVIRLAFISAASAVLFTYLIPDLRSRFLNYGARSAETGAKGGKGVEQPSSSIIDKMLDQLATFKVPHSWFISFYATSVTLSSFWFIVLPLYHKRLAELSPILNLSRPSTPFSRTQLASILMLLQGVRRLIECYTMGSSSSSTMWIGHWLVGIGFYIGMSVAIWIEGTPALIKHTFSIYDLEFVAPTFRSAFCLFVFLFASGIQHDCHTYLASLKGASTTKSSYKLPDFPAFSRTLTPHYLMECLIYSSLAVLTAPKDHYLNATVVCALIFAITNLGVTAVGTRQWYERKFGKQAIAGRWAMIPFIL